MFNNRILFISGGTGSFGNCFIKKICSLYKPKKLIIYSRDEYKQYEMQKEFPQSKFPFLRFLIGDVRDYNRLKFAMKDVDYLIHAAALKHVPTAEYNPLEFIKTNINGAENIIRSAIEQKVKRVIALSTDKAANPINLYGATKFVSDKLFISAKSLTGKQDTIFSVVRYGNVLGSRGSVVSFFNKLKSDGENIFPITHNEMTRFWISLDQAVEFVIFSLKKMIGGEILIPKLPSIRIIDLAKSINNNAKFKFIGVRPGEKIHELMCPKEFNHLTYEFKNHFIILDNNHKDILSKLFKNYGKKPLKVKKDFEYNSELNSHFLKINEIKKFLEANNL